jgi:hypothetical protein
LSTLRDDQLAWRVREARFNHDWLKNGFLPALAKWVNVLSGSVEDQVFEGSFALGGLLEWERQKAAAASLLADYESLFSPRALFDRGALRSCSAADRAWLEPVARHYWEASRAGQACEVGRRALLAADAGFLDVVSRTRRAASPPGELLTAVRAFWSSCVHLNRAFAEMWRATGLSG